MKPAWLFNDCVYVCFHITGNACTLYRLLFVCNSLITDLESAKLHMNWFCYGPTDLASSVSILEFYLHLDWLKMSVVGMCNWWGMYGIEHN